MSEAGKKYDADKPRWDLVPLRAHTEFVDVLTFGAMKYTANGWRKVVGWRWRYTRAGLGHVIKYMRGERNDAETGKHHLAHALCCFYFVLEHELTLDELGREGSEVVPDGNAEAPPKSQKA
jgi:hypothetical protein